MNEIYEALKGFTDLPIAAVSLILGFLSLKKDTAKGFPGLFFLISASASLGGFIHIARTSKPVYNIVWTVLYLMLFEAIRRFSLLLSQYIKGAAAGESPVYKTAELIAYPGAVITMITVGKYDMLFLVAFSILCMVRIIMSAVGVRRCPKKVIFMVSALIPLPILQAFSERIPYSIVAEHVIICILLFSVYSLEE